MPSQDDRPTRAALVRLAGAEMVNAKRARGGACESSRRWVQCGRFRLDRGGRTGRFFAGASIRTFVSGDSPLSYICLALPCPAQRTHRTYPTCWTRARHVERGDDRVHRQQTLRDSAPISVVPDAGTGDRARARRRRAPRRTCLCSNPHPSLCPPSARSHVVRVLRAGHTRSAPWGSSTRRASSASRARSPRAVLSSCADSGPSSSA
jgi:hypothetical protein